MDSDPPFQQAYKTLIDKTIEKIKTTTTTTSITPKINKDNNNELVNMVEECELPLIDLSRLHFGDEVEREECKAEIARASQEWGFFQVVNHGISCEILEEMRFEQERVFKQPFDKKIKEDKYLNFSAGTYRWGTPTATCLKQLAWSEAFHIPLLDISNSDAFDSLSSTIGQFATTVSSLAQNLAEILAEKMGHTSTFFQENCLPSTCYLRMNRYPPCPIPSEAWSNDVYKSVEHRVVTNPLVERFSTAYFLCPSYDTVIQSCRQPSVYRKFSFREFRQQVQEDVKKLGSKIGLPRFLIQNQ
ncbi:gibberellin 2-beta-dioxygenase 8 [Fagus crenata]